MKLFLPIILLLTWTAAAQPAGVLHAARLLDVETGRMVSPGEILVRGGRIAEIGPQVSHPAGAPVRDLGDCTLLPGLIDAHVHLFLHPGAEDLETVPTSWQCREIRSRTSWHCSTWCS
jgi:imidazolonepropionase-like amidohydrolase